MVSVKWTTYIIYIYIYMLVVNNYTAAIVMEKKVNRNHDGDWDPFLYVSIYLVALNVVRF
jgi:hypothetical protein